MAPLRIVCVLAWALFAPAQARADAVRPRSIVCPAGTQAWPPGAGDLALGHGPGGPCVPMLCDTSAQCGLQHCRRALLNVHHRPVYVHHGAAPGDERHELHVLGGCEMTDDTAPIGLREALGPLGQRDDPATWSIARGCRRLRVCMAGGPDLDEPEPEGPEAPPEPALPAPEAPPEPALPEPVVQQPAADPIAPRPRAAPEPVSSPGCSTTRARSPAWSAACWLALVALALRWRGKPQRRSTSSSARTGVR